MAKDEIRTNWQFKVRNMAAGPDKDWLARFARHYLAERNFDAIDGRIEQLNAAIEFNSKLMEAGGAGDVRVMARLFKMLDGVIRRRYRLKEAAAYYGIVAFIKEHGRQPEIPVNYFADDPIEVQLMMR